MWKISSPGAAEPSKRTVGLKSRAGKPANLTLRYCPGRMVIGGSTSTDTSMMSDASWEMPVTSPDRFDTSATCSNVIAALPMTLAWQASTVFLSAVPKSSTWPLTTVTRQVSHCPEQQSCGMATQPDRPASTSVSPWLALTVLPLMTSSNEPLIPTYSTLSAAGYSCVTILTARSWRVWRTWV